MTIFSKVKNQEKIMSSRAHLLFMFCCFLVPSWGPPGTILGHFETILGPCWDHFVPSWDQCLLRLLCLVCLHFFDFCLFFFSRRTARSALIKQTTRIVDALRGCTQLGQRTTLPHAKHPLCTNLTCYSIISSAIHLLKPCVP